MAEEEKPVLREMSWKQIREFARVQRVVAMLEQQRREVIVTKDFKALEKLEDEIDEKIDALRSLIAPCIKYLPASWLVEGAPDKLDWDDPASQEYLRASKIITLSNLIQGGKDEADEEGKG